jgi:hypothetical protein
VASTEHSAIEFAMLVLNIWEGGDKISLIRQQGAYGHAAAVLEKQGDAVPRDELAEQVVAKRMELTELL